MILTVEEWRAKAKGYMDIVSSYLIFPDYFQKFGDKAYQEKIAGIIENEPDACYKVSKLSSETTMEYLKDTGKRYSFPQESECKRFLKDYFFWLANQAPEGYKEEEVIELVTTTVKDAGVVAVDKVTETIKQISTTIIEKITPEGGIFGIGNKVLLGVIGVIVALVVILIILVKVK